MKNRIFFLGLVASIIFHSPECFSENDPVGVLPDDVIAVVPFTYSHTWTNSPTKAWGFVKGSKITVNNNAFNGDPSPGFIKFMFLNSTTALVAVEGSSYYVPGLGVCDLPEAFMGLRGAAGTFYNPPRLSPSGSSSSTGTTNGSTVGIPGQRSASRKFCSGRNFICSIENFGDPAPGAKKSCYTVDGHGMIIYIGDEGDTAYVGSGGCMCGGINVSELNDYQKLNSRNVEMF